jgi:hypothetical protein
MLAAMFLPRSGDELTLEAALQTAADLGMVLCIPRNFSPDREFFATCFPPDRIPAGWKRAIVVVKTHNLARLEDPCVA